jgi:hypothetical protein
LSEYDPFFGSTEPPQDEDLDLVREAFERASRPYVYSPWPWVAWALVLAAAAWITPLVLRRFAAPGVLMLWSVAILVGGAVELVAIRRRRRAEPGSTLARWVFRAQGNLSLVGVALSAALLLRSLSLASLLPGLWLLLLGHSFFAQGGLAFPPLRRAGLLYQAGGVVSLILSLTPGGGSLTPGGGGLTAFAVSVLVANLSVAWALSRRTKGLTRTPAENAARSEEIVE